MLPNTFFLFRFKIKANVITMVKGPFPFLYFLFVLLETLDLETLIKEYSNGIHCLKIWLGGYYIYWFCKTNFYIGYVTALTALNYPNCLILMCYGNPSQCVLQQS